MSSGGGGGGFGAKTVGPSSCSTNESNVFALDTISVSVGYGGIDGYGNLRRLVLHNSSDSASHLLCISARRSICSLITMSLAILNSSSLLMLSPIFAILDQPPLPGTEHNLYGLERHADDVGRSTVYQLSCDRLYGYLTTTLVGVLLLCCKQGMDCLMYPFRTCFAGRCLASAGSWRCHSIWP